MTDSKIEVLVLLWLLFVRGRHSQLSAVITPRGYNASLDPEASFTFQCDVTGTNSVQWFVDGSPSSAQEIRDRGISASDTITVDEATSMVRRSLSILRNITNRNTTLRCVATAVSSTGDIIGAVSDPVLFKIQGLLDAPLNLVLSEAASQHMRRLSWDEPFSLDITDVDPDIECYNVCYSLVNVSAEKSQCTCVNQTEYTFLCVSVPLLFTVSAVNVVGEGEATSIPHNGCSCTSTTAPSIVSADEVVSYSRLDYNPTANFFFQQLSEDSGTTCFLIYEVKTSLISEANTTNHGIQIPRVAQYSQSSVHLSLTVDSDLLVNEMYLVTVTAINTDGERNISVTTEFDTYDVQSVSGRAIPGGLELNCTFAEGSQAQSCILTVCRLENGMEEYCMNLTIIRENLQQSGQLTGLQPGLYMIKNVNEVESDGSVTLLRRTIELQLTITEPPLTTTPTGTISDSTSAGGVSSSSVGTILGGVVAVLVILLLASIILTVVTVAYHRRKLHHRNQETPQVAVYEEPYDWAVSRLPQTEPTMEQCPAYGVLTK